jgi:AAA domain/PLD-like domain
MPDWRDEVSGAVRAWLGTVRPGVRTPTWRPIGTARPEGQGWFVIDLRGAQLTQTGPEDLETLRLSRDRPTGATRSDETGYRVLDAALQGEILRVRVAAHVVDHDLRVWALKQPPTYLIETLRDCLAALNEPGLADALANGRLSPLPPSTDGPLNPEQQQAYAACRTPGLRLVWGPPGTGKTMVLRRAIADLVTAGKRVLLVSSTNIAVDNALAGVVDELKPPAGLLVRVGTPQLLEIARNAAVSLPSLKAARCREVADRRVAVEQQLVELGRATKRLEDLTTALEGYDHEAYVRAASLLTTERRIASIAEQAQERAKASDAAGQAATDAEVALVAAASALEEIGVARDHLEEAARLERQLERMDIAVGGLHAETLEVDADRRKIERRLNAIDSLGRLEQLSLTGERRRLRRELKALVGELADLAGRERDATYKAERYRKLVEPEIRENRRRAKPVNEAEVKRRVSMLKAAQLANDQAISVVASAEEALDRARLDLLTAEAGPRPTPEHRRLVAEAERERWPHLYAELAALRQQAQNAAPELSRLEQQHEQLIAELERLGRGAEKVIIREARLIATTLARFRLNSVVYQGPYDVVLVDEVSAATAPEVLLAVAKAAETAVLFGDFLQLGAVTDEAVKKLDNADVERWLLRDCFSLCGIENPSDAEESARQGRGCIVLSAQYRFGADLMDLANRLMYADILRSGRNLPSREDDDPEIVMLDTDGLDDLANVRRTKRVAGWWPAGTLLARILAQQHLEENATVGIISPYGPQAQASLEALRNIEGTERPVAADAGTAHRFQGREFDFVVFDLVEDGTTDGWMAQADPRGNSWQREGVRLFNVAATRARHRLYLIGSRSAVDAKARGHEGAPLRVVHELLRAGRIRVMRATELLTPVGADPAVELDPFSQGLAAAAGRYVRIVGIHDERSFFAVLEGYLGRAQESIWIWAPWTAGRAEMVLPLLKTTVGRGVRVSIFTRPERAQSRESWRERLQELRAIVPRVVAYANMHQKIVVVDRRVTLLGSLNPLSHRDTREVMVEHEGQWFATNLLQHEHAEHFANPPECAVCKATAELRRATPDNPHPAWSWRCGVRGCAWTMDATPPGFRTHSA